MNTYDIILGYWAIFRTNSVIRFYLKCYQKHYLNSLKKNFFLVKYYQALTKFQYDLAKRQSQKKWYYYNLKVCGVFFVLFALLLLLITIHSIFKLNLSIFSNN
jgi:hypothetical protein